MGLDKIANKTTESQADFKLVANGCSSGISWIDTTLTGNASQAHPSLLYRSLVIHLRRQVISEWVSKNATTDDATFLKPNSAE